jgi:hypothetical protein
MELVWQLSILPPSTTFNRMKSSITSFVINGGETAAYTKQLR